MHAGHTFGVMSLGADFMRAEAPSIACALQEADRHSYDIHLEASIRPSGCDEGTVVTRTNFSHLCALRTDLPTCAPHTSGCMRLHNFVLIGVLSVCHIRWRRG